MSIDNSKPRF